MIKDLPKNKDIKKDIKETDIYKYWQVCDLLGYQVNTYKYISGIPTVDKRDNLKQSFYTVDYTDNQDRVINTTNSEIKISNKLNQKKMKQHLVSYLSNRSYSKKIFTYKQASDEENKLAYCMEKTYGSFRKKYSNVIGFDIDNHNGDQNKTDESLRYLTEYFESLPFLIEESTNGGYHVFYKFEKSITTEQLNNFIYAFNEEHKTKIEIHNATKALRLPESYSYSSGKLLGFNEIGIPLIVYFETVNEMIDFVLDSKNDYKLDNKFIEDLSLLNYDLDNISENNNYHNLFFRKDYEGNTIETKSKKDIYNDFPITAGNRVSGNKQLFKLANYCIYHNYDFEIFLEASIKNNKGSHDLTYDSPETTRKKCEQIYEYCSKNFNRVKNTSNSNCTFQSNLNLVPDEFEELIENYHYLLLHYHQIFEMNGKVEAKFFNASKLLIKEMLGKAIYESYNPRYVNEKARLTKKKKENLSVGFVFSREFFESFKKYYELDNIDIYKMGNMILKKGHLFTQFFHNKSGYSFGKVAFSRQWVFEYVSSEDIYYEIEKNLKASIYYLKKTRYSLKDPELIEYASELKKTVLTLTTSLSTTNKDKKIYNYVVNSLSYDSGDKVLPQSFQRT